MSSWAEWLAMGAAAGALLLVLVRATDLFCLSVREGRVSVRRGRIPQRLLDDITDVVRGVRRARLRAVRDHGRARLVAEGDIDEVRAQRLRNLLGTWSLAQLRTAPRRR